MAVFWSKCAHPPIKPYKILQNDHASYILPQSHTKLPENVISPTISYSFYFHGLELIFIKISKLEIWEKSLKKSHIFSKRQKEKTPSLSNIASSLTPHQDQPAQNGKDSNEPAKKKQSSVDKLFVKSASISVKIRWVLNLPLQNIRCTHLPILGTYFLSCFPIVILRKDFSVDVPSLLMLPISV